MTGMSRDDKIDAIYQMVKELSGEVKGLKSDVKVLKNDVKDLKEGQDKINARLDILTEDTHENKADIRMLKNTK